MISLTVGPAGSGTDWLGWTASVLGALAWPLAALTIALIFRRPLLTLLARDRKSTRLNSSHIQKSRMPSSA